MEMLANYSKDKIKIHLQTSIFVSLLLWLFLSLVLLSSICWWYFITRRAAAAAAVFSGGGGGRGQGEKSIQKYR